ncbi:MAG: PD-(D/E)XK nuclease family protein [Crocinitomicaceae bacterium]|nr:PD-(D/E)XK nuclease family protein [Crocinitomicaceae bacterium]
MRVLDHNYISLLIKDPAQLLELEKHILEHNQVFIDWQEITKHIPELGSLEIVFMQWQNPIKDTFTAMNKLVSELYTSFKLSAQKELELEMLYHFSLAYKKFESISKKYPYEMELKSFKRLFYQFWQSESLSFLGNPIEGVQIMGILETRLLDFENLIILGMNEGNLPQTNVSNSFIPFDLKKHHNLPTEEDRQAIFAHHFYRLLHRAKNVYMTYNSGGDDGGNSEKSRYITQLENELDPKFGHQISHSTYTPDDRSSAISKVQYLSVDAIHQKLDTYFSEKGLSPSALNKLINCPLDFYYRYILEMKENEQVEENIESSTFGTKIHDVLEDIFRTNFLEKNIPLSSDILKKEKPNLEKYLHQTGNVIRIVDYKSGKCDDEKVVITKSWVDKNELYKLMDHDKKGYARQLLMYASMYRASNKDHHSFSAGIISMININDWLQNVRIGNDGEDLLSEDLLNAFEDELKKKIELLYNPHFIFEHNPDSQYCEHCDM